ncbi:unnamed protein product [Closterium sp. Naga37s-1]|nr:unnamed protein product [Closterium sp. Naga37s-1]
MSLRSVMSTSFEADERDAAQGRAKEGGVLRGTVKTSQGDYEDEPGGLLPGGLLPGGLLPGGLLPGGLLPGGLLPGGLLPGGLLPQVRDGSRPGEARAGMVSGPTDATVGNRAATAEQEAERAEAEAAGERWGGGRVESAM